MLSTGRITESIGRLAIDRGWEAYIVHGARYTRAGSCMHSIKAISKWGEYEHYVEGLLLDNHGLASRYSTQRVIEQIKKIKPDIVQLHCIHGYYLNYRELFNYLNSTNIPVIWTFHDCWAFTGHCAHPLASNCSKWKKEGCHDCPNHKGYPKSFVDRSSRNFQIKRQLFSNNYNLHIVTVSRWLADFSKESFLGNKDIQVINNGIDIDLFKPCADKPRDVFKIIGVASVWSKGKGLYAFYKLRELLPDDFFDITLVGLSQNQVKELPKGIKGITRTDSIQKLTSLYSESNVMINPTDADSFPTVNIEALSCGTPVITYDSGGGTEIIDEKTGIVVKAGDVNGLAFSVKRLVNCPLSSDDCRDRAVRLYNKDERFLDYIKLYERLLNAK